MELRQIEFFLQLYKDRNITVASQNLYISQQGMSKSIANLEKEVGFPLFKRSVSGVKPTAEAPAMSPIKPEIVPKIPPTRRTSGSFNPASADTISASFSETPFFFAYAAAATPPANAMCGPKKGPNAK